MLNFVGIRFRLYYFASSYRASAKISVLVTMSSMSMYSLGWWQRSTSPGKTGPKATVFGTALA